MDRVAVSDAWFRAMRAAGEPATLRRTGYGKPNVDVAVYVKFIRVSIRDSIEELDGQSSTTERRLLLLCEDIGTWPLPIVRGDQVIIGDLTLAVHVIDSATRRFAGLQVAIELEVYGA